MTTHTPEGSERPFLFLHVGDQHLTVRDAQNNRDLRNIFEQIAGLPPRSADFLYLPGDIAENGAGGEYALMTKALREYPLPPVYLIPGDHDRQYGTMTAFHQFHAAIMGARHKPVSNAVAQYYFAEDIAGVRCIFLDMISAGAGQKGCGLDFFLGDKQREWLEQEVARAAELGKTCAVFMHTYPADENSRATEAPVVAELFWEKRVRLAELGHTHYNEIAHDGRTTFAAARSVGQNEDGSVGYAVCAIDGGEVSWRFKPLDRTWPFVLITSPVDRRLATKDLGTDTAGNIVVRAVVLSDLPAAECCCRVDGGCWHPMTRNGADQVYVASVPWPSGSKYLTVRAVDPRHVEGSHDFVDSDTIEPGAHQPPSRAQPARRGTDDYKVGVWPEKGVRGDQLGPNRAGRKW